MGVLTGGGDCSGLNAVSDRWERSKAALYAALEQEPSKRVRFIERLCRSDPELLVEVRSLLDGFKDGYLESPVAKLTGPETPPPRMIGPYRVLERIGKGGMGEVFRVADTEGNLFALKRLPRELVTQEGLSRFKREALAASSLEHRNIVRFIELVEHEGRPHILMEYLEGRTLKYYLQGEEPLDIDNVFAVSIQLAEGLESAHAKGIVHRDLKPGNIFVTRDGSLKLLDFGIAKLVDAASGTDVTKLERITRTGQILGTAEYMAPEQARGEAIDARVDVFSFGCVLYQMLTGRSPFAGENVLEKFGAIMNEDPEPLSELVPSVPEPLASLAESCLKKHANDRPQTMTNVLFELRKAKGVATA